MRRASVAVTPPAVQLRVPAPPTHSTMVASATGLAATALTGTLFTALVGDAISANPNSSNPRIVRPLFRRQRLFALARLTLPHVGI